MSVPPFPIALRTVVTLLLLALASPLSYAATRPPDTRVSLESLGYVPFSTPVLTSGASILTLNYVDNHHLLVTFSIRRLLKRIPDDPPQDVDRSIDAVLVDLPSGNVLARTAWRMHDPAQYLWPLGNGHFLLRIRDRLSTISPLLDLKSGDAFKEHPLLVSPRPIGAVLLSPDASLLILESLDHLPPVEPERSPSPGTRAYAAAQAAKQAAAGAPAASPAANQPATPAANPPPSQSGSQSTTPASSPQQALVTTPLKTRTPVEIHFYRLRQKEGDGELYAQSSGALHARTLVSVPADGAGFISILDEGRQHWAFNYNFYRGKVEELSPFDSTCHPVPVLVSRSEFIAFGCRSGTQRQMMGGFNLRGEEMWEQGIPETYLNPAFAFAPPSGRFAFGRVTTDAVVGDPSSLSPSQFSSQLVTVFQTDSGKPVLRLECTPILPAGQNFDLSPDGADLAIIRDSVIEIHHLPPLSAKDRAGIAKAAALAPEPSEGPILLSAPLTNAQANAGARAATAAGTPVATPPTDPASHRPSAIVDSDTVVAGSADSESTVNAVAPPAPVDQTVSRPAAPTPRSIENGDPQPETDRPRKPPTLYNPGETSPTNQQPKSR